jgi:hypothetical protein
MTNDELNPNDEIRNGAEIVSPLVSFGLRYSFALRHSCFVI